MGTVRHLWLGESWGLSHTCDAETASGCYIPVMWDSWGLSLTYDWGELGAVTYL